MAANPMTQFNVYRIGPEIKLGEIDISFTNASLFMVISTIAILLIFSLCYNVVIKDSCYVSVFNFKI